MHVIMVAVWLTLQAVQFNKNPFGLAPPSGPLQMEQVIFFLFFFVQLGLELP